MITIQVNNQKHQFSESISLQAVLKELAIKEQGIAVAVNEQIISKSTWSQNRLKEADNVLIIKATQGG